MVTGQEQHDGGKTGPGWAVAVLAAAAVTVRRPGAAAGALAPHLEVPQAGTSPHAASGAATVKTSRSSLGMILTDGRGRAVYLFEKDTGTKPSCSGTCAAAWPPVLTTGDPVAGSGVQAGVLLLRHRPRRPGVVVRQPAPP